MFEIKNKDKIIKKCIWGLFLVLALSVVLFIILKYQVEGEKNIPFTITKLITISSAKTDNLEFYMLFQLQVFLHVLLTYF